MPESIYENVWTPASNVFQNPTVGHTADGGVQNNFTDENFHYRIRRSWIGVTISNGLARYVSICHRIGYTIINLLSSGDMLSKAIWDLVDDVTTLKPNSNMPLNILFQKHFWLVSINSTITSVLRNCETLDWSRECILCSFQWNYAQLSGRRRHRQIWQVNLYIVGRSMGVEGNCLSSSTAPTSLVA